MRLGPGAGYKELIVGQQFTTAESRNLADQCPTPCRSSVWVDIFWGDDHPSSSTTRGWIAAEEGMLSIITLISVLFFLILVGFLGNIALIINQKIEVQNGADSIALSASQVQARGMNAVTASNHLIGELLALVVIHHAFGGDELDEGKTKYSPEDNPTKTELNTAYSVASALATGDTMPMSFTSGWVDTNQLKEDVNTTPQAGATLFDSVIRLRKVLAWSYYAYAIGGALQKTKPVPIAGPILYGVGVSMCTFSLVYITRVKVEREILSILEDLASSTKGAKQVAIVAIQGLHAYQLAVFVATALQVEEATADMARQSAVTGETYPNRLPPVLLPIQREPDDLPSLDQSQLARAMWPWTDRWRCIVQDLMWQWLRLARSANYYEYYSHNFAWDWIEKVKNDKNVHLWVMQDLWESGGVKGNEPWTTANGSERADELFCVMGFATRDAPRLASSGVFKPQNSDGVMAYAQGMIYNANPQGGGGGENQMRVGWDTLNWANEVKELPPRPNKPEFGAYHGLNWDQDAEPYPEKPQMFLNWRAKLVPETRLRDAANLPGHMGKMVQRLIPVPRSLKTH